MSNWIVGDLVEILKELFHSWLYIEIWVTRGVGCHGFKEKVAILLEARAAHYKCAMPDKGSIDGRSSAVPMLAGNLSGTTAKRRYGLNL